MQLSRWYHAPSGVFSGLRRLVFWCQDTPIDPTVGWDSLAQILQQLVLKDSPPGSVRVPTAEGSRKDRSKSEAQIHKSVPKVSA